MTILYIVSECAFSALLLFAYRKNKSIFTYGLAALLLIDMLIKVINIFILLPTVVKAASSTLVLIFFVVFLVYWTRAAAETEKDTDNIRSNKWRG